jgi:hypothetical protein
LAQSGHHADAIEKAQNVFGNSDSSILSKFNALLTIEEAELLSSMVKQEPQQNYYRISLTTGQKLKELTKNGPPILKFHAIVIWETAKLQRLAHRYHGLLLNWIAHKTKGNVIWKAQLVFERTHVYRQILAKYNQCIRLANYGLRIKGRADIPRLLMRIVSTIAHFIRNLESEHLDQAAASFSTSTLEICKLSARIAQATNDDDGLFTVAAKALMTKHAPIGEAVEFARETVNHIKDEDIKQRAHDLVSRIIRSYQGEKLEGPIKTTPRQVYENMATALGVDLTTHKNPISDIVRLGLDDLNPSRVLINCEHIFITLGPHGLLADLLDMPTAGHKIIHCDLHEYAVIGVSLDSIYTHFKNRYCDSCNDCLPRPSTWEYSDDWQQEQNEKHLDYMERFYKRTGISWTNDDEGKSYA